MKRLRQALVHAVQILREQHRAGCPVRERDRAIERKKRQVDVRLQRDDSDGGLHTGQLVRETASFENCVQIDPTLVIEREEPFALFQHRIQPVLRLVRVVREVRNESVQEEVERVGSAVCHQRQERIQDGGLVERFVVQRFVVQIAVVKRIVVH